MPDAMTFTFTETDLEAKTSYDDFEPGEYTGVLTQIHDAVAKTGNKGWRWEFTVQGLPFSTTTWFGGKGGWRLAEVLRGLGETVEPGAPVRLNPRSLVGKSATLKIGYDKSSNRDDFLTILRVLPQEVEAPSLFDFSDSDAKENPDFFGNNES